MTINEAEKKVKKIIEDREAERQKLLQVIEKNNSYLEKYKAELENAVIKNDKTAFKKAKSNIRGTEDNLELYNARLNMLKAKNAALVKEMEALIEDLQNIAKKENDELKKYIVAEAIELYKKCHSVLADIYKINQLAMTIKREIMFGDSANVVFNDFSVINWGQSIVKNRIFFEETGCHTLDDIERKYAEILKVEIK